MSEKAITNKMGVQPIGGLILKMGVPMILSMMLQAFYNIVDSYFVSNMEGVGDAAALAKRKFVFVVGGVEYRCCRFQACFVSGLVRRLLASDRCLSRVSLKVCDDGAISRTL